MLRLFVQLIATVMPSSFKIYLYRSLLGWKIGEKVEIGLSYISAEEVEIQSGCHIGHFNAFRNLRRLQLGENSYIRNFNQFSGILRGGNFCSEFITHKNVLVMNSHYFDVAGSILIESYTTVGGTGSQFWSHGLAMTERGYETLPSSIRVRAWTYIGARSILIGCTIPRGSIIGAGSVVTKSFPEESTRLLIAGNPADIKKRSHHTLEMLPGLADY
jgi:acetyltransferase-like isoleucine patch superfamily enzyme